VNLGGAGREGGRKGGREGSIKLTGRAFYGFLFEKGGREGGREGRRKGGKMMMWGIDMPSTA